MEVIVNGIYVEENNCTATPLKFGKSVKDLPNEIVYNYFIRIDMQSFKTKFETAFNEFVYDYKKDDELYPGQEDNLLLKEKGYPKLQDLIDTDRIFLAKFIMNNLGLELIDCIFDEKTTNLQYVICNITDLEITDNSVIIKGDCIKYYIKD